MKIGKNMIVNRKWKWGLSWKILKKGYGKSINKS